MKTFLKIVTLVGWVFALVAAVMGDTTAANVMMLADDDSKEAPKGKK